MPAATTATNNAIRNVRAPRETGALGSEAGPDASGPALIDPAGVFAKR